MSPLYTLPLLLLLLNLSLVSSTVTLTTIDSGVKGSCSVSSSGVCFGSSYSSGNYDDDEACRFRTDRGGVLKVRAGGGERVEEGRDEERREGRTKDVIQSEWSNAGCSTTF